MTKPTPDASLNRIFHSASAQVNNQKAKSMSFQHTLKSPISCTGVGLHSGAKTTMRLCPAEPNSGVTFVRTDLDAGKNIIPARYDNVTDTQLCTLISNDHGASVGTIEHVMAALAGCGIDNLRIELDGPEVPIMDGSSAPFVFLVECAGTVAQPARRRMVKILKETTVQVGDAWARFTPGPATTLELEIDFDGKTKAIKRQASSLQMIDGAFQKELSRARTFGFLQEVDALRKMGLCRGGSLDNAIVIDGDDVMNEEGLRYEDEFARHKLLDSIGDLYLAGSSFIGHFDGFKSGHGVNNQLLRALFADPTAFAIVEAGTDNVITPISLEADEKIAAAM